MTSPHIEQAGSEPGASSFQTLDLAHGDGVEWLTLARPGRFNAVDETMAAELKAYFSGLCDRMETRVVVLQGAGKHFCAGFDLDNVERISSSVAEGMRLQRLMSDIVLSMRRCPQPIVALVQGAACGAGFALALAADVRYAAADARMNVAMARIGLTGCDMGISYFLPRAVGRSNASELMMGGRFVDANRALRIGLVSDVVAQQSLVPVGELLVAEMMAMSPLGLRLTKQGVAGGHEAASLEDAIALEDRGQVLCIGPHMREGVAAFREKRAARYLD